MPFQQWITSTHYSNFQTLSLSHHPSSRLSSFLMQLSINTIQKLTCQTCIISLWVSVTHYCDKYLNDAHAGPTVLHPNLKLWYFQTHGWEKAWVDTAKILVREKFKKYEALCAHNPTLVCLAVCLPNAKLIILLI